MRALSRSSQQSPRSSRSSMTKTGYRSKSHDRGESRIGGFMTNGDKYEGGYVNGRRHGTGTYWFTSGAVYSGEWKKDRKHGRGKYYYVDGSIFDGDWLDDRRDGYGVYQYRNGDRYEGEWRDHMRHGRGTYYHSEAGVAYVGNWVKDQKQPGGIIKRIMDGACQRTASMDTLSSRPIRKPYEKPSIDSPFDRAMGRMPSRQDPNHRMDQGPRLNSRVESSSRLDSGSRLSPGSADRLLVDLFPGRRSTSPGSPRVRSPGRSSGRVISLQKSLDLRTGATTSDFRSSHRAQSAREFPLHAQDSRAIQVQPPVRVHSPVRVNEPRQLRR